MQRNQNAIFKFARMARNAGVVFVVVVVFVMGMF
jgi:hypothetical protein